MGRHVQILNFALHQLPHFMPLPLKPRLRKHQNLRCIHHHFQSFPLKNADSVGNRWYKFQIKTSIHQL